MDIQKDLEPKILLINPLKENPHKTEFMPLGLCYLAGNLKKNNIKVSILDASNLTSSELTIKIKEENPSIIGIPCWTIDRKQAYITSNLIKLINSDIKIIIGGYHATAFPEQVLYLTNADIIVVGAGEETIVKLCKALLNNKEISNIKGIAYIKNNKFIKTEKRKIFINLDSLPFPVYDGLYFDDYTGLPEIEGTCATIITSRGCPHSCIYCASRIFWEKIWIQRSAENVIEELIFLKKKYDIKGLWIYDDNFVVNKKRAIKICQGIIDNKLNIKWVAEANINNIDNELMLIMKKSGCYRIDFGLESGSPKIWKNLNKKMSLKKIRDVFKFAHKIGIKPRAYLIVGSPGETKETIDETIKLMKEIKPYFSNTGQLLWVLPNTPLYEKLKESGFMHDNFWLHNHDTFYYTKEHDLKQLNKLRNRLNWGLARNYDTVYSYYRYFLLRLYNDFPLLKQFYHNNFTKLKKHFNNIMSN